MSKNALLCLDLVNDCVHPDGKLKEWGFVDFAEKHNVTQRIARIQEHFREQGGLVIHMRTCYSKNYAELPLKSPVLGDLKKLDALKMGTWGTEFLEETAPKDDEPVVNKYRIGSFHRTRLEIILRTQKVENLYLVGVSTLGSVCITAQEAHDYDFNVSVIKDGCLDRSTERHEQALNLVNEYAEVVDFEDMAIRLAM